MSNKITPPDKLVQEWTKEHRAIVDGSMYVKDYIATQTARYRQIADAELEACCEWLSVPCPSYGRELRNARRPKPPSLVEGALDAWDRLRNEVWCQEIDFDLDLIRAALERLQELEKGNE